MIVGDELTDLEVNSDWDAQAGPGCELSIRLASGHTLFAIRTAIASTEEEVATWREERLGQQVARTKEITRWPLGNGGEQVTLDVELDDGFTFEADLILGGPDALEEEDVAETEDLETEWVFEGTPGEEMGPR